MRWLTCFLLLTFCASFSGFSAEPDWEEMEQLVEQAEELIQQQAQELEAAQHQLEILDNQLKVLGEQCAEQQSIIRRQKLLLGVCGTLCAGTLAALLLR